MSADSGGHRKSVAATITSTTTSTTDAITETTATTISSLSSSTTATAATTASDAPQPTSSNANFDTKSAIAALIHMLTTALTQLSNTNFSSSLPNHHEYRKQTLSNILPSLHSLLTTLHTQLASTATTISSSNNSSSTNNSSANNVPTANNSSKETILNNFTSNIVSNTIQTTQKMLLEAPPFVHLSPRDAAPQLRILSNPQPPNSSSDNSNNSGRWLTVKGGMRGYRMVRASHGVRSGNWYFEVLILDPPSMGEVVKALPRHVRLGGKLREGLKIGMLREKEEEENDEKEEKGVGEQRESREEEGNNKMDKTRKKKEMTKSKKRKHAGIMLGVDEGRISSAVVNHSVGGHLRIGWSMRTGELQAPVGYDRWSYGYRDISGSRVHNSKREDRWGGEAFGPGDVVGFAIGLVDGDGVGNSRGNGASGSTGDSGEIQGSASDPNISSHSFSKHKNLPPTTNHIRFFKNGEAMGHFLVSRGVRTGGEAFSNIQAGTYYPAISSYMGGAARANFGPYFLYPPRGLPSGMKVRPVCEAWPGSPPPPPSEVVEAMRKEKIFLGFAGGNSSGRGKCGGGGGVANGVVDEKMVEAFYEAVRVEAEMRFECYENQMRRHLEEVREGRTERGLRTDSLPATKEDECKDMDSSSCTT